MLASVSIIGYTAFTKKAVQNNALNELSQAKTLVVTEATEKSSFCVYDGTKVWKFSLDENGNIQLAETTETEDDTTTLMKAYFEDLSKLDGTFSFAANKVTYTLTKGSNTGSASWDLAEGTVTNEN